MEKYIEVLSPAGDINSFKTAISAGADAVYLGMGKFNARMKAENVESSALKDIVDYAHLRGVKVYVTINTLVSDAEITDLIDMVGDAVEAGVDAYIVQDLGVIYALRNVYPGIVLHGSTQLGVHNVRGARVAKSLGLSRVVLSRETTIEDIKQIAQSVDIELEVFVQGAMCVAFSGNCYMSSLKFGASGNRGLCKQLCRLPYTLSAKNNSIDGYALSPRDNCMIGKLKDLIDAGVVSLKIEGRLRRAGYVAVATSEYRKAVDCVLAGEEFDVESAKLNLARVFARGEFVEGYNAGKGVIDYKHNNHTGTEIGKVVRSEKFKDIYRIVIDTVETLSCGDGLRFIFGDKEYTLGVGNVDSVGKYICVYGKNCIPNDSKVYRVLDSAFESEVKALDRYKVVNMTFEARLGESANLRIDCEGVSVDVTGEVVHPAKSMPLSVDSIKTQLSKINDEAFSVGDIKVDIDDNIFMAVSQINAIRRECVEKLKEQILLRSKPQCGIGQMPDVKVVSCAYDSLAIVDESANIEHLVGKYEALILAPTCYDIAVLDRFLDKYNKCFGNPLIIKSPIIALAQDMKVIDAVARWVSNNGLVLMASNVYALDYIKDGVNVMAGSDMNICNKYAVSCLSSMGVNEIVATIEPFINTRLTGCYKMCGGKRVLMTMAHCPNMTLNGNRSCSGAGKCGGANKMSLVGNKCEYTIRRYVVGACYFELVDSYNNKTNCANSIDDLRG